MPLDGPVVLRIAADAQRTATDYLNDHIWEIVAGGEPAALALRTSFGRRATRMRIFPSFGMGGPVALDPAAFAEPPRLEALLPSYARLGCSPLAGLDVTYEVRVQDSQTVCGRVTLINRTEHFRPVRLGLHAELAALPGGQAMFPRSLSGVTSLAGKTASLAPVVFLSGGAGEEPGTPAGLVVRADLAPGASKSFLWAEAALADHVSSFNQAREAAGRSWDGEVARLERIHSRWVETLSGNADWDAAFRWAQQSALDGLVGPGPLSPHRTLVLERTPDRGFSVSGDGRDYDAEWVGPSSLEAYHIVSQMVWAAPELAAEVLRRFWEGQSPDSTIDARPGPAGQRARRLCPPLLACLTIRVDEVLQDERFLDEAFRALWPFYRAWFAPPHDRDGDGWPEWDQPSHLPWPMWWTEEGPDAWVETSVVEDPALLAMLYREAQSLETMAHRLGRSEAAKELAARRAQLRALATRAWSEARGVFLRVERDQHVTSLGESVAADTGPTKKRAAGAPAIPGRLVVRLSGNEAEGSGVRARIRGRLESGRVRVETMEASRFHWHWDRGWGTTELIFASVESVELSGIPPAMAWTVSTLDLGREDLSLFLPLWAGMVEREQADRMVRESLMNPNRYLRPGGWAITPTGTHQDDPPPGDPRAGLSIPLNLMIAEGLLLYGYRREAADLLGRLLNGQLHALRTVHGLAQSFDPQSLQALGRRNHLQGTPPLSLFLGTMGVGLRSPGKVFLEGNLPFDGEVIVRWRGAEIRRTAEETLVTFPSGATSRIRPPDPVIVEETPAAAPAEAG
jgi:hypothetical protein